MSETPPDRITIQSNDEPIGAFSGGYWKGVFPGPPYVRLDAVVDIINLAWMAIRPRT